MSWGWRDYHAGSYVVTVSAIVQSIRRNLISRHCTLFNEKTRLAAVDSRTCEGLVVRFR